jgi:hypothetical protein
MEPVRPRDGIPLKCWLLTGEVAKILVQRADIPLSSQRWVFDKYPEREQMMRIKIKSITYLSLLMMALLLSGSNLAFGQQTIQSKAVLPANVSGELLDLRATFDDRKDTRAHSDKKNYVGMSFTIDLGNEQNVIGVSQDHGHWPTHAPGAYRVDVAVNPSGPWMKAWEGEGQRGESKAKFPAILARYIRVTATALNDTYREEWSVAELRGGIDPGQTARRIPDSTPRPPNGNPGPLPPAASKLMEAPELALDNKAGTFSRSGRGEYEGMFYLLDLGGEYEISRVIQVHGSRPEDYPGEYKIEVSRERNENRFREVFRGKGQVNRSVARFEPVVTRYIKITALSARNTRNWWSIDELRTNRDNDVVDRDENDNLSPRAIRNITAQGFSNINAVVDDNNTTRASTRNSTYIGNWVQIDLGGSYTVSRVLQIHDPDERDFPARYQVEVSSDGNRWQKVFEGQGERGRSVAEFTPVRSRFVRIIATDDRNNRPWAIYKLKLRG